MNSPPEKVSPSAGVKFPPGFGKIHDGGYANLRKNTDNMLCAYQSVTKNPDESIKYLYYKMFHTKMRVVREPMLFVLTERTLNVLMYLISKGL